MAGVIWEGRAIGLGTLRDNGITPGAGPSRGRDGRRVLQSPALGGLQDGAWPGAPHPELSSRPRGRVTSGCHRRLRSPPALLSFPARSSPSRGVLVPGRTALARCQTDTVWLGRSCVFAHGRFQSEQLGMCAEEEGRKGGKPAVRAFLLMSLFYHVGVEILCKESN